MNLFCITMCIYIRRMYMLILVNLKRFIVLHILRPIFSASIADPKRE